MSSNRQSRYGAPASSSPAEEDHTSPFVSPRGEYTPGSATRKENVHRQGDARGILITTKLAAAQNREDPVRVHLDGVLFRDGLSQDGLKKRRESSASVGRAGHREPSGGPSWHTASIREYEYDTPCEKGTRCSGSLEMSNDWRADAIARG